jgi:ATP-binding cassette subfamily C protein CydCD
MLAELRDGLKGRTVVLVTHNPDDIGAEDSRLDLDDAAATTFPEVLAGAS